MRFIKLTMLRNEYNDDGERSENTTPVVINVAAIRAYYPRKAGQSGTRITFTDGGGFAVNESPDAVEAAILDLARVEDASTLR